MKIGIIIDSKRFEDEPAFENHVNSRAYLSPEDKKKVIMHERAHYREAVSRGYSPEHSFECYILRLGRKGIMHCTASVNLEGEARLDDLRSITSAPEDPSLSDRINLQLIKLRGLFTATA